MKKINIVVLLFLLASLVSSPSLAQEAVSSESYVVKSPDKVTTSLAGLQSENKDGAEIRRQIKRNGYYDTHSENAASLIAYKNKKAIKLIKKDADPYYKNLRHSPSEFSLSFPFSGISSADDKHLLGFAPSGTLEDGYWTGVTGYFNDDNLGTCRFVAFDMPALQGQAVYDPNYTTYEINGKPTISNVEGNEVSGFIYHASWTGKRYEKMLECANKKPFDKEYLMALIVRAKEIDNDLPDTP